MSDSKVYRVYRPADIETPEFKAAVKEASDLWYQRCKEYVEKNGDVGSCVLGSGIALEFKGKGKRKVETLVIITPQSPAQGSCTWESSVQEIIDLLATKGIVDCWYTPGRLD